MARWCEMKGLVIKSFSPDIEGYSLDGVAPTLWGAEPALFGRECRAGCNPGQLASEEQVVDFGRRRQLRPRVARLEGVKRGSVQVCACAGLGVWVDASCESGGIREGQGGKPLERKGEWAVCSACLLCSASVRTRNNARARTCGRGRQGCTDNRRRRGQRRACDQPLWRTALPTTRINENTLRAGGLVPSGIDSL